MRSGIIEDFDNAVEVLRKVNSELCLYEVDGQFVFPVYAQSGGLIQTVEIWVIRLKFQ